MKGIIFPATRVKCSSNVSGMQSSALEAWFKASTHSAFSVTKIPTKSWVDWQDPQVRIAKEKSISEATKLHLPKLYLAIWTQFEYKLYLNKKSQIQGFEFLSF